MIEAVPLLAMNPALREELSFMGCFYLVYFNLKNKNYREAAPLIMIKAGPLLTMDPALKCDFLTSFNCISFNLSDSWKNKN